MTKEEMREHLQTLQTQTLQKLSEHQAETKKNEMNPNQNISLNTDYIPNGQNQSDFSQTRIPNPPHPPPPPRGAKPTPMKPSSSSSLFTPNNFMSQGLSSKANPRAKMYGSAGKSTTKGALNTPYNGDRMEMATPQIRTEPERPIDEFQFTSPERTNNEYEDSIYGPQRHGQEFSSGNSPFSSKHVNAATATPTATKVDIKGGKKRNLNTTPQWEQPKNSTNQNSSNNANSHSNTANIGYNPTVSTIDENQQSNGFPNDRFYGRSDNSAFPQKDDHLEWGRERETEWRNAKVKEGEKQPSFSIGKSTNGKGKRNSPSKPNRYHNTYLGSASPTKGMNYQGQKDQHATANAKSFGNGNTSYHININNSNVNNNNNNNSFNSVHENTNFLPTNLNASTSSSTSGIMAPKFALGKGANRNGKRLIRKMVDAPSLYNTPPTIPTIPTTSINYDNEIPNNNKCFHNSADGSQVGMMNTGQEQVFQQQQEIYAADGNYNSKRVVVDEDNKGLEPDDDMSHIHEEQANSNDYLSQSRSERSYHNQIPRSSHIYEASTVDNKDSLYNERPENVEGDQEKTFNPHITPRSQERQEIADEARRRASDYYTKKDYIESYKAFTEAILLAPDSWDEKPKLYCNRAATLVMLHRYEEAIEDCRVSLTAEPHLLKAMTRCGRANLHLGNYEDALECFTEARNIAGKKITMGILEGPTKRAVEEAIRESMDGRAQTERVHRFVREAEDAFQKRDYSTCIRLAGDALKTASRARDAMKVMLLALAKLKKWDDAVSFFERIYYFLPTNSSPLDQKKTDEESTSKILARIVPLVSTQEQKTIITCLRFADREADAIYTLKALIQRFPATPWYPKLLEQILSARNSKEEGDDLFKGAHFLNALEKYQLALDLDPENDHMCAVLHYNRGACYMGLKQYKEAVEECNEALRHRSNYFKAMLRRARAYRELKQYNAAVKDFSHYIKQMESIKSCDHDDIKATEKAAKELEKVRKEFDGLKIEIDRKRMKEKEEAQQKNQSRDQNSGSSSFSSSSSYSSNGSSNFHDRENNHRNNNNNSYHNNSNTRDQKRDDFDDFYSFMYSRNGGSSKGGHRKPSTSSTSSSANSSRYPYTSRSQSYTAGSNSYRSNYDSERSSSSSGRSDFFKSSPRKKKETHYNILNISSGAESAEIKKAYRKLALKYHPDKNKEADADVKFKKIVEAYDTLSDDFQRRKYDRILRYGGD